MSGVRQAVVFAAALGAGTGVYTADQNRKSQNQAADAAKAAAEKQLKANDEAQNRANKNSPDSSAILSAAQQSAKSGVGGTMLTGAGGAAPGTLGKPSLLGS
jgi:uncharacterized protein HemX